MKKRIYEAIPVVLLILSFIGAFTVGMIGAISLSISDWVGGVVAWLLLLTLLLWGFWHYEKNLKALRENLAPFDQEQRQ